jgi:hypothetical protein
VAAWVAWASKVWSVLIDQHRNRSQGRLRAALFFGEW